MSEHAEVEITLEDSYSEDTSSDSVTETEVVEVAPETGTTEATEEKQVAEPEGSISEPDKDKDWRTFMAMDEKRKRQALEKELAEIKNQQPTKEPTSFFEDEAAARLELRNEIRNEFLELDLKRSEKRAIETYGEDKVTAATEWFNQKATLYPSLLERFHNSHNSVGEVVKMFEGDQKLAEMDNVDTFRQKIAAEERAKILVEMNASETESSDKKNSITPSLATQTSSSAKTPVDESLEGMWGR